MITALPQPPEIDPYAAPALRWGILGTGWIADRFVAALQAHTGQVVAAVGSRSAEGAVRFAAAHGIATAHPTYDALVADPQVDVVYVATPHNAHLEHALLAIAAGKHVLVEKPLCLTAAQARRLADAAAAAGVFAMEALWTLFLPKYAVLGRLLADGVLGELCSVQADIGEWFAPTHRIFDPALAGGAMMDMATYPVTFALWAAGAPHQVAAVGTRADSGVVSRTAAVLQTPAGVQCLVEASIDTELPTTAAVAGSDALLRVDGPFYQPGGFTLAGRDGTELRYDEPTVAHAALFHQAVHVATCIGQGRLDSPIRPLADSILLLETMDRIRACTGDVLVGEDLN